LLVSTVYPDGQRMLQRDLHQTLRSRTVASHARVAELARSLDPEQVVRRPPDGGWSVGEVLEHLCVTYDAYQTPIRELLRRARPDAGAPLREWKPSLFGGMLARGLEGPRRMWSPKVIRPSSSPRGGVLEKFLAQQLAFATQLDESANYDWRALTLRSPLVPPLMRFLARLNLGDAYTIHAVHVERHTKQMERAIATIRQ
jgi:hypothetical protein